MTSKSRTRKVGDSMAHCSAQPRETHSLALSVRETGLPNTSSMMRATEGMRVEEPTTSTHAMSAGARPASASACASGERTRSSTGAASASKPSRFIVPRTSTSSIRHSMASCASELADRMRFICAGSGEGCQRKRRRAVSGGAPRFSGALRAGRAAPRRPDPSGGR